MVPPESAHPNVDEADIDTFECSVFENHKFASDLKIHVVISRQYYGRRSMPTA